MSKDQLSSEVIEYTCSLCTETFDRDDFLEGKCPACGFVNLIYPDKKLYEEEMDALRHKNMEQAKDIYTKSVRRRIDIQKGEKL